MAELITMCTSPVLIGLGIVPVPGQEESVVDLPMARHFIDLLALLDEKTADSLSAEEQQAIDQSLHEPRMAFVQVQQTVTDSESGKYAYATRLKYSGLKQAGAPIPEDIALGLRFISSPSRKGDRVEEYGHITDYEHLDPSLNPNALDPDIYVPRKKATSIHLDSTYLPNTHELLLTS